MDRTTRQALVDLEQAFWHDEGGDPRFWEEHFADDGVVTLAFGVMDKPQTVAAMSGADPWVDAAMEDVRVVDLGGSAAVVTYRVTARRAEEDEPYRALVGSVYVRRDDAWRLAFHQQTPAADGAAASQRG